MPPLLIIGHNSLYRYTLAPQVPIMKKIPFFFILLFISTSIFTQEIDSLTLHKLENYEVTDTSSFNEYNNLIFNNHLKLSNEQFYKYVMRSAEFTKRLELDTLFVQVHFTALSLLNNNLIDFGEGKTLNIEKSIALAKEIEKDVVLLNINQLTAAYYNLAGIPYQMKNDYVKALEYYTKSLEFLKKSKIESNDYHLLSNIIKMYYSKGAYDKGVKYVQELLAFKKYARTSLDSTRIDLEAFRHYAIYYKHIENEDSLIYYTDKTVALAEKIGIKQFSDFRSFCQPYYSKINLLLEKEEFIKAAILLEKIDTICKGVDEPFYTFLLGDYYIKTGKHEKVGELLKDTFNLKKNRYTQSRQLKLEIFYQERIGNYKEALMAQKELSEIQKKKDKTKRGEYTAFMDARLAASKQAEEINTLKIIGETEKLKIQALFLGLFLSFALLLGGIYAFRKLKQKNQTIEEQSAELKKVEALKSKLFTNISHELRTPLTLISGPIKDILKRTDLSDSNKKQLSLAHKSSEQLLVISNQIMDLNKNETELVQVNLARFHWNDFLDSTLPSFEELANRQGLTFSRNKTFPENVLLQSDPTKLKAILSNLLQNAIKFSKNGGSIQFDTIDKENHLEFSIKDTGIGIAPSELPRVFNRYYQSKNNTQAIGGFGIGLAVCQEYVKLLGGTIKIDSKLGAGTTVTVNFPKIIGETDSAVFYSFDTLATPYIPLMTTGESIRSKEDSISTHLLIVEDNADLRIYLESILREEYTLSFAINGAEALKMLETITPSLILTDWMMQTMNGLELVENLKANPTFHDIPILMLTARSLSTDQLKAFRKGVDDYILKPFEPNFLKLRIEHLLDFSERRKETQLLNTPNPISIKYQSSANEDSATLKINNKSDQEWISQLETVIQSKINQFDLTLKEIYSELRISKTHFNRKVKIITGLTPMQFIDEVRFWEARRLLEEKEVSAVKSAAYAVGFKSVKNFSRNFKKRFGDYPSDYFREL